MRTIPVKGARLGRMFEQLRNLREQWKQHTVVALENGRDRIRDRRHDAESHVERRRFRSDAQLRAERAEDERRFATNDDKHNGMKISTSHEARP